MNAAEKRRRVAAAVREQAAEAKRLAIEIHGFAEPPFREEKSARALADYLAAQGFDVRFAFRRIPTAFRAEWGAGKPVVGLLGEYDALPDCGAQPGTWGHGCGHNLLGVGAAVGAVAARAVLEARGGRGTVVYYGCPAEESLAGKVYMARDGAFRELDACLAWHPGSAPSANNAGGSALDSLVFEFHGRTAHGAYPTGGRSALDAAILMDVAANYLREHVPENVRIHAVIPSGGNAPNVVPAYARIWYYVRGKDRADVDAVRKRLVACARGAAIATETRFKMTRLTAIYSRLPNDALCGLLLGNLRLFGPPAVQPADLRRARAAGHRTGFNVTIDTKTGAQGRASSDEDSVSWLAPLGRFNMPCAPKGVRGHHRDQTAQGTTPFAIRGMLQAGQVFAGTVLDLCSNRRLLQRIRREFEKRTKGFHYDPLIPARQKIPTPRDV